MAIHDKLVDVYHIFRIGTVDCEIRTVSEAAASVNRGGLITGQ